MKTEKQVIGEHKESEKLIREIYRNVGDSIEDIYYNGADGGYYGFIYNEDLANFYKKHRRSIIKMLDELSSDYGSDNITTVSDFNGIVGYTKNEIGEALYGKINHEYDPIYSKLVWHTIETVCGWFMDEWCLPLWTVNTISKD